MTHLTTSLAWCWLQILLVAAVAIPLSLLVLRKSPAAGAAVALSGVVATLALTILAFMPLPTGIRFQVVDELVAGQWRNTQPVHLPWRQRLQAQDDDADQPTWALDGALLLQFLKSLRSSESAVVRHRGAVRAVFVVFAVGCLIGLPRLTGGLLAIVALRRRSSAVTDRRLTDLLSELTPCLPLSHLPQVRETPSLDSAAVVGWWRPTVLLPAAWRDWSPPELQAVLAHELAHIARHDAPWRLVAALLVALHWGHPLIHWLRRQLLLAQELAADETAAAVMGSKREYLQALAKLALRQDSRPPEVPPPALVPVFSGFLLRRIAMLRAKDGSLHRNWRLLTQGCALGLVAAVTLSATAIRGLADPPEPENDGSIRVAKANDPKPVPPAAALFQRPPFDIARLAVSDQGGFLIRLGEILNQPRFAKAARQGDEWLAKHWPQAFPGAEPPPASIQDIEYIAGDCNLWARYVTPAADEQDPHPHQLLFGSLCGVIHFRKPVDEIFNWLKRTPSAEVKQHGGFSYVSLPIAILGPAKTHVCRFDDHTLLWSAGEGAMKKRLDQLVSANDPPPWQATWKKVDGGLLTAVSAESEYENAPEGVVDDSEQFTRDFFAKTRLKAIGADWQPHAHGNTSFKIQFRFDNEADARSLEAQIRRALELYLRDARERLNKTTKEEEKSVGDDLIAMLEHARVETRLADSGWQIEIHLSGPIDIESNL
jgi:beta-lactamase regulating signal transducer with metallopeptidase domain